MRRYGRTTDETIVAGKNAGLKLALAPLIECTEAAVEECAIAIDGLYWFSDESGAFDATVEAAALGGPVLAIAKLIGNICDEDVIWMTEWTPEETEGPAPDILENGDYLVVFPTETTAIGMLTVTAECNGETYGPILLNVIQSICCPDITGLCISFRPFGFQL